MQVAASEWTVVLPSIVVPGPTPRGAKAASGRPVFRPTPRGARGCKALPSVPLPEALGSSTARAKDLETRIQQACGRTLAGLGLGDVNRSKELRDELTGLRLADYFDDFGKPRFRSIGLMLVAEPEADGAKRRCGSRAQVEVQHYSASGAINGKAAMFANATIEQDLYRQREECERRIQSIPEADRCKAEAVEQRRVETLFGEVPSFERYLPPGVRPGHLHLLDLSPRQDAKDHTAFKRENAHFSESEWHEGTKMGWMFTRSEAQGLSKVAGLWASATGGAMGGLIGMDRATFCRLVLDLGLVDQDRVPFFWAVSLFDEVARPIRCCNPADALATRAPVVQVVSRWLLISVLDTICRQHFTAATKGAFFGSLPYIARRCLPAYVVQESGLHNAPFDELAAGRAVSKWNWRPLPALGTQTAGDAGGMGAAGGAATAQGEQAGGEGRGEATSVGPGGVRRLPSKAKDEAELPTPRGEASEQAGDDQGQRWKAARTSSKLSLVAREASKEPVYNRFSGQPASSKDIEREEAMSDMRLHSMLLEPEVLHVVTQHRGIFSHLHASYAGPGGDLSFASLLQFCIDFHLVPQLINVHALQRLYETGKCLDLLDLLPRQRTPSKPPRAGRKMGRPTMLSLPVAGRPSSRACSVWSDGENSPKSQKSPKSPKSPRSLKPPGVAKGPSEPHRSQAAPRHTSEPRSPKQRRATSAAASEHALSPEPPSARRHSRRRDSGDESYSSEGKSGGHLRRRPSDESLRATEGKSGGRRPSGVGSEGLRSLHDAPPAMVDETLSEVRRHPARFGPGALAELLLRLSFGYLGGYASLQQQNMSGYLRAVWFVTYLKNAFVHLQASLKRRDSEGKGASVRGPLRAALEGDWMLSLPGEILLPAPTLRAGLPPAAISRRPSVGPGAAAAAGDAAVGRTPRPAAEQLPSESLTVKPLPSLSLGEACVAGDQCRLCGQSMKSQEWGDPTCPGCSVVDSVSFRQHLLKGLMVGLPPGIDVEPRHLEKPVKVVRGGELTPPPTLSSNALRVQDPAVVAQEPPRSNRRKSASAFLS